MKKKVKEVVVKTKPTKKEIPTCPWCGVLPLLVEFRGGRGFLFYYGCENLNCLVNPKTQMMETKAKATSAWLKCKRKK